MPRRWLPIPLLLPLFASACLEPALGAGVDLVPPAVVSLSLGDPRAPAPVVEPPPEDIRVRFSEPLDPFSVDEETVLLVEGAVLGSCPESGECPEGICLEGTCAARPVDAAFREDANRPPLAASRRVRAVPVSLSLSADPREVRLAPRRPLERTRRYALVLSAALRDRAGNPLASPDGRVQGVVYEFYTGAPGAPRPRIVLLVPEPGAADVATNLAEARVAVTGEVLGVLGDGLWLEGPAGPVPTVVSRQDGGCPAGFAACYRLTLGAALAPHAAYRLVFDPRLRDREDRPLPGSGEAGFVTGGGADTRPPGVEGLAIEAEGGCLEVVLRTDEPARVRLRWTGAAGGEAWLDGFGVDHRGVLPLDPAPASLTVETWDAVGNRGEHGPVALAVEPLAPVAISEVLANPAGSEPAQEFVELVNLGAAPVSLSGWRITDDLAKAGDPLPGVALPGGAVALVVPSTYDSAAPEDPSPAPGTVLLVLGGSTLGSAGLANGGEPVYLLDDAGRVVSAYPGAALGGGLPADGQSVGRALGASCAARGPWQIQGAGTSTPGWLE